MKSVSIKPILTMDEIKEMIIKLCKLSGEENGHVRVFVSNAGIEHSSIYALFDNTIAQKPVNGTKEVTFKP